MPTTQETLHTGYDELLETSKQINIYLMSIL